MDPGEDEWITAWRETEEEAGLRKDDLKVCDGFRRVLEYKARGKKKTVEYWLAESILKSTNVKLSAEHCEYEWCPLERVSQLCERFPDQLKMIKEAQKFLDGKHGKD